MGNNIIVNGISNSGTARTILKEKLGK